MYVCVVFLAKERHWKCVDPNEKNRKSKYVAVNARTNNWNNVVKFNIVSFEMKILFQLQYLFMHVFLCFFFYFSFSFFAFFFLFPKIESPISEDSIERKSEKKVKRLPIKKNGVTRGNKSHVRSVANIYNMDVLIKLCCIVKPIIQMCHTISQFLENLLKLLLSML